MEQVEKQQQIKVKNRGWSQIAQSQILAVLQINHVTLGKSLTTVLVPYKMEVIIALNENINYKYCHLSAAWGKKSAWKEIMS